MSLLPGNMIWEECINFLQWLVGKMKRQLRFRLKWLRHLARMQEHRLPKMCLFGWLPQTRPCRGPRRRWELVQCGSGQGGVEKSIESEPIIEHSREWVLEERRMCVMCVGGGLEGDKGMSHRETSRDTRAEQAIHGEAVRFYDM